MIRGEKVILRALELSDAEQLQAWANDAEVTTWLCRQMPMSLEEQQRSLQAEHKDQLLRLGIQTFEGKLIGSCSLRGVNSANACGRLGIGIGDKEYWDGGYGTDAMLPLCGYGFAECNLHRIELCVYASNARAIRCYEKCGFAHEGRAREAAFCHGQYQDTLSMGLLRSEYQEKWPERWAAVCR
jgi:RimJ/RimL family protein N-acetyltransferase